MSKLWSKPLSTAPMFSVLVLGAATANQRKSWRMKFILQLSYFLHTYWNPNVAAQTASHFSISYLQGGAQGYLP